MSLVFGFINILIIVLHVHNTLILKLPSELSFQVRSTKGVNENYVKLYKSL